MSEDTITETVNRSGNSLAVVIPSQLVKKIGIKTGDKVEVEVNPVKGFMTVKFLNIRQLPLV